MILFDPIWYNFNLTILGEADKEFQAIIALIHEVEGFAKQYNVPGANINPYTNLTGAVSFFFIIGFSRFFFESSKFLRRPLKFWRNLPLDKVRTFWKAKFEKSIMKIAQFFVCFSESLNFTNKDNFSHSTHRTIIGIKYHFNFNS